MPGGVRNCGRVEKRKRLNLVTLIFIFVQPPFFFSFALMHLRPKHKICLKVIGFVSLLVLMVVLNNNQKKEIVNDSNAAKSVIETEINYDGIANASSQIPNKTESTLPIKLISNPNTNFLYFINHSFNIKNTYTYLQLRKEYLNFCSGINTRFLIEVIRTTRNKDIK